MISLRVFVGQDVGESKPTQKGLTVHVKTLPKLIGLLLEAEQKALAENLLSPAETSKARCAAHG